MLRPEGFIPNFDAIDGSEIWTDQIAPMLDVMYFEGLENRAGIIGAPLLSNQDMPTTDEYHFWRGWVAAIRAIRELPTRAVSQRREMEAQEKKDAFAAERESRAREFRRKSA
jgi:hypothetical protein